MLIQHNGTTIHKSAYAVGCKTTAYDGESLALAASARLALQYTNQNHQISRLFFFSDNALAITNISCTNPHTSQPISISFINYARSFLDNPNNSITIQWVPGHKGIGINVEADRLARRGTRRNGEIIPRSLSYDAEKCSRHALRNWRKEYNTQR